MAQTNNLIFFILLVWTFKYSYESFGISCNKIININNTSDMRKSRLLYRTIGVDSEQTDFDLKEKFPDNFQNSYNSLKFKGNFENSCDSLTSVDYLDGLPAETEWEPYQMKKHKSGEKNILSSIYKYLRKLDAKYEREVKKLFDILYETSNKYGRTWMENNDALNSLN
ncbi:uncharacterized protein MKS88_000322 [Plasmodium brasilianum]|uniref:uncharacterized protein n=1 Tax=Plasmodium brasilianum TaxID=5824 RepID=UPI00350E3AB6|nr:hypothetical protein MKS88_000322 [Plasmodium brasilianum]